MNEVSEQILYIDDDPDDLFLFSEALASQAPGYEIIQAISGEDGLTKMREMSEMPSLIILDMNMPRIDGLQILKSIRQNPDWQSIPVVLLTTSASSSDIALGKIFGASFVNKPMTYDGLKEAARTLAGYCRRTQPPGS